MAPLPPALLPLWRSPAWSRRPRPRRSASSSAPRRFRPTDVDTPIPVPPQPGPQALDHCGEDPGTAQGEDQLVGAALGALHRAGTTDRVERGVQVGVERGHLISPAVIVGIVLIIA